LIMEIKSKAILTRIITTIIILLITITLSLLSYSMLWKSEEEYCWETLSDSAESISREITVRMEDNHSILSLAAGTLAQGDAILGSPKEIIGHLNEYRDMTMFSRIDVIYPDSTILLYDGRTMTSDNVSFEDMINYGDHMSNRYRDVLTGRESIFLGMPVMRNGEPLAVMVGVIDCLDLTNYFQPSVYDGKAKCMLVDRTDGNVILDGISHTFGNIHSFGDITALKGYEGSDLIDGINNAQAGVIAYRTEKSGGNRYMYYTPVHGTDWQLLVMVEDEQVFARHQDLRRSVIAVAIVEALAILFFMTINLISLYQLSRSKTSSEQQLHKTTTLVECVTELSSYSNINHAINNLLAIINRYFDGDRTYLFDIDYENQTTSNTYEYAAEGITKEIDILQNVPLSSISTWLEAFRQSGLFYISEIDHDVIRSSNTYEILAAQGIRSLIAVPLLHGDVITGFMGVDNPRKNYDDLSLMSSVQFFLTEALNRKDTHDALTQMSYTDTLTRLHNRNRFNYVCDKHLRHYPDRVGVAFFDLDGLKQVNDTLGHDAGDQLIITTADCIRSMFSGNSYRIGGDEFAVILPGVSEEDFEIQVDRVRKLMKKNGISAAIGISWHEKCTNIRQQLKEADERMYVEKAEHRRIRAMAAENLSADDGTNQS